MIIVLCILISYNFVATHRHSVSIDPTIFHQRKMFHLKRLFCCSVAPKRVHPSKMGDSPKTEKELEEIELPITIEGGS